MQFIIEPILKHKKKYVTIRPADSLSMQKAYPYFTKEELLSAVEQYITQYYPDIIQNPAFDPSEPDTPVILHDIDPETPVSITGPLIRADFYNAGEGLYGDYNPENPDDVNLLRFDIYILKNNEWEPVEDASYCTNIPAGTIPEILERPLMLIYKEYNDALSADPDASVKKLGEALSWITI